MNIFDLNTSFTKKELKQKFIDKLNQIKLLELSDIDMEILINHYYKYYNYYKLNAVDFKNDFTNNFNSSSIVRSYQKKLNPDNTYTVVEIKESNINGKVVKSEESYIIDIKGNKIKQLK
jgi:hypothetical protein